MGKALRPEHLKFFTARMNQHSRVMRCELIANQNEYLFRVRRTLGESMNDVIIHLTDAYRYGFAEYFTRPRQIKAGSYVVIGIPHADAAVDVIEAAREDHIGVGHIGKVMGALNLKNVWEYMTPEERRRQEAEA